MNVLKKIGHIYDVIEEKVLCFSLIFAVLLVFYQIIMRFVFSSSLFGSEELARYIFMWQIWLGASIGFRDDKHIRIELLIGRLKGKTRLVFDIVSDLAMIAFCIFCVYYGQVFLERVAALNMVTPALRIPFVFVYACVPVSMAIVAVRIVIHVVKSLRKLFAPPELAAAPAAPAAAEGGEA